MVISMSESIVKHNRILRIAFLSLFALLTVAFSGEMTAQAAQNSSGVNAWSALQDEINSAKYGDTIMLGADVTATESDVALSIPDGMVLTLDLNGHTIERNLTSSKGSDGSAIRVQSGAALTVKDSLNGEGKITGGYASHGGGICNVGTLILEGGCITGNFAKYAGGGVANYGVFIVKSGTVTANTTGEEGGGIYNASHGYLIVPKSAVYDNHAPTSADIGNDGSMKTIGGDTVNFVSLNSALDIIGVLPVLVLLIVLFFAVRLDNYLNKRQKRVMYIITVLVLSLVIQNYLDTCLYHHGNLAILRTINSIYGYSVRPAILAMFLYIISPDRSYKLVWAAVGVNAAVYMTALFSPLTFSYSSGHFISGPLKNCCVIVSAVLFIYCVYMTVKVFRPKQKKETWIPVFLLLLISLSVVLDYTVEYDELPISFLTIAVAISCMMYYIWLHLQFVRGHERALQAEHRIQIMMTQIQPHFLFNTLTAIRALCVKEPEAAAHTIGLFSAYLRQNLDSLNQTEVIPLSKEIEHTRIYTEIETIRFPNIRVEYDLRDEACFVPALTIQPLVENAIRHGVRSRKEGIVKVSACREGNDHIIVIEDNGIGFKELSAKSDDETHIGINNVRERLKEMCNGTMTIDSKPNNGTKVVLRIPVSEEMNR